MSSSGISVSSNIVAVDTDALISQADAIVRDCTGPNCNTSTETRNRITQQSSILAQSQANTTLAALGIPISSEMSRRISVSYNKLGASVAAVYNFQCGNNPSTSNMCVNSSTSVKEAQQELVQVLEVPVTSEFNHFVSVSILVIIIGITVILFIIFLIFGIITAVITPSPQIIRLEIPQ